MRSGSFQSLSSESEPRSFHGCFRGCGRRYFRPSWYSTQGVCVQCVSDRLTSTGMFCSVTLFMSVHMCSKHVGHLCILQSSPRNLILVTEGPTSFPFIHPIFSNKKSNTIDAILKTMLCFQIHVVLFLFLISLKDTVSFLSPEERRHPVGLLRCFRSLTLESYHRGSLLLHPGDGSWPR